MAYNEKLTNRLREALDAFSEADGVRRNIEEKKMFRGVTFMVNGKMCVSVGDDEFMFRIDPERHDEATAKEGVRTVVMKGRNYIGYVRVPEDAVKTKRALDWWINLALDFNTRAVAAKKKKRAGAKKKTK